MVMHCVGGRPLLQVVLEQTDFIPEDRIYTDELRRLCWGTDAGFYRMVPKVVVRAADEEEVSRILPPGDCEIKQKVWPEVSEE